MTPERWQRVRALFEAALSREPREREELLAAAASEDAEVAFEVRRLLALHDAAEAEGFLDPESSRPAREEGLEGRWLGSQRLLRMIGRGGMGSVYEALRVVDGVEQVVAVKVVGGWADSPAARERFRAERRILARLEHPSIARFIDAGTTEQGVPYLVMEHVEGLPVTTWCDARRLDVRARLELFRVVCAAVHHAHQSLVLHRDLKPGNILVTEEGTPKLLDFGIARLLEPEASGDAPTLTLLRQFTPDYASPEQVRGRAVTTASDVYSLGLVLYELLTGHRPQHVSSLDAEEILRVVCLDEPPAPSTRMAREVSHTRLAHRRPSAAGEPATQAGGPPRSPRLVRELRGDLDTIVLTALHKDPARRYGSAERLGEDLQRYLTGRPILARPDSLGYRARKFVRRNPAAAAAGFLVAASLLAGGLATAWQARRAERERARAERRFQDLRGLARSVVFEMHDAIEDLPGATPARRLLVQRSLEYLDRLARDAAGEPELQLDLGRAYIKVGDVQGRPFQPNLGDSEGALSSYRKARALLEDLVREQPAGVEASTELAFELTREATLLDDWRGESAMALDLAQRALGIQEALAARVPGRAAPQRHVAQALLKVGDLQERLGRQAEAVSAFERFLGIAEALAAQPGGEEKDRAYDQRLVRIGDFRLATVCSHLGRHGQAAEHASRALEGARQAARDDPGSARARRDLAATTILRGEVALRAGSAREALPLFEEARALHEAARRRDPSDAMARLDAVSAAARVAGAREALGETRAALQGLVRCETEVQELVSRDPQNFELQGTLAGIRGSLARLRLREGDAEAALAAAVSSLGWFQAAFEREPARAETRYDLAAALLFAGRSHAALASRRPAGEKPDAHRTQGCDQWRRSLELLRTLDGPAPVAQFDLGPPKALASEVAGLLAACGDGAKG